MATETKTWKELGRSDQGRVGQPGSQYSVKEATVESNGSRYRLKIREDYGSNQGYLQSHRGEDSRQYRADSLDELMRIAIAAEKGRDEADEDIMTAIREAIYEAEDSE